MEEKEEKAINKMLSENKTNEDVCSSVFLSGKKKDGSIFMDLGWYVVIFKRSVVLLVVLELIVRLMELVPSLTGAVESFFDPVLLLMKVIVFGHLVVKVKKKFGESFFNGLITAFLAGLIIGTVSAIYKMLWYWEFWTVFNLIIEPVFMGLLAVVVGFVAGVFVRRSKII